MYIPFSDALYGGKGLQEAKYSGKLFRRVFYYKQVLTLRLYKVTVATIILPFSVLSSIN